MFFKVQISLTKKIKDGETKQLLVLPHSNHGLMINNFSTLTNSAPFHILSDLEEKFHIWQEMFIFNKKNYPS